MKFISSNYNKETGESTVIMEHMGLQFIGTSRLNPEDKENASEYAGCEYAEIRATIKALKYERKVLKQKSDMAIDFVKACENYAKFNKEDASAKSIYRQMNRRIKAVNDKTDEINSLYRALEMKIFNRNATLKAIERKKKSKQDN